MFIIYILINLTSLLLIILFLMYSIHVKVLQVSWLHRLGLVNMIFMLMLLLHMPIELLLVQLKFSYYGRGGTSE